MKWSGAGKLSNVRRRFGQMRSTVRLHYRLPPCEHSFRHAPRSEGQPQAPLNVAGSTHGADDCAGAGTAQAGPWQIELRVIEEIKELRIKLKLNRLADRGRLGNREVEIGESVAPQSRIGATLISKAER